MDALLEHFKGRRPDARAFALRHRVLLLQDETGVGLDVALGAVPFEENTIARASRHNFGTTRQPAILNTCSAEDLIVHKSFAGRGQDWVDVRGILIRQRGKLDLALVHRELSPLAELKGEPEILTRLDRMIAEIG